MLINYKTLFVHIPRTGGRFVVANLNKNHNVNHIDYVDFKKKIKDKNIPHLNRLEYRDFLHYIDIETFTIVRDPVDRFLSMLKCYNRINESKIKKMFESQLAFNETVDNLIIKDTGNWFLPQIHFIDLNTKIWKYEKGLKEDFQHWVLKNFNLYVDITRKIDHNYDDEIFFQIDINDKQKQFIKNYYYQDYKILEY
jgi:hypothetical protein|tara:strand:+ start:87 stop:674 length:588 start_codon:yes stop_codon:yes gene_type:complete